MEKSAIEQGNNECASSQTNLMDCKKCQARVRKLQLRIAKALEAKRYNKAKALQYLLDISLARKCIEFQTKEPI